jgi:hypothetical protein
MLKMLLNLVDCINYILCVTHLDGPVNIARAPKLHSRVKLLGMVTNISLLGLDQGGGSSQSIIVRIVGSSRGSWYLVMCWEGVFGIVRITGVDW